MYIDTHCHISKEDYSDIDQLILENKQAHIVRVIASGCDKESIKEIVSISKQYKEIYLSLGYHPSEANKIGEQELKDLEIIIKTTNKIVAIGEIGLDYHYDGIDKEKQQILFRKQLLLAKKYQLPVVIHSRDATEDTIAILKEIPLNGIIHCFTGSIEIANRYISMGYKLGIGGVVTFKNSKLKEVIKEVSLEDIVFETDAPYLAPEPYRGKQNSSKFIPFISKYIADIKKIPEDAVQKIVYANTCCLFDLNL